MTFDDDRYPLGLSLPQAEREQAYSPSSRLPDRDLGPFLRRYRSESERAAGLRPPVTVRYGPELANTIDLAVPDGPADASPIPLHVFIHGGYWQELSKLDSYFLAPACATRGLAFAAVDYTLAPAATLASIVDECRAAIRTLRSVAHEHGFDREAITVSGSSAGAHLAAMATIGLPAGERPSGLVLVSGIYLLEPLVGTSINDAVGLDPDTARDLSPLLGRLDDLPPTVVAYGDDETDELKRQSRALVDAMTAAGALVTEVEVPDRNHFDVVFDIVPDLTEILATLPQRPGR